jgi:hypothetical protein
MMYTLATCDTHFSLIFIFNAREKGAGGEAIERTARPALQPLPGSTVFWLDTSCCYQRQAVES